MIRFATGAFVAAFLGASLFDHVRFAAFEAQIDPAGLFAVVAVAAFVAVLFALVAFAAGGRRTPRVYEIPSDATGVRIGGAVRRAYRRFRDRNTSGFVHPPLRTPGVRLDPEAPNVRALREVCRQDARALIAEERRKLLTYLEPVHLETTIDAGAMARAIGKTLPAISTPLPPLGDSRRGLPEVA